MIKRRIIINADDFGLSLLFNKGILELAQKEIISSVSVMINRNFVEAGAIEKFNKISLGLHLELSSRTTKEEIEDQIKKFVKEFKKLPSHLDGHNHCHLTLNNLPLVIKVAKQYKLPVRSHFDLDRQYIRKNNVKTPQSFISWHPRRREDLFKTLKSIKIKTTVIELVCHPGYYDSQCQHSYNRQREVELKILKSCEFKQKLKKFQLINYYEL